MPRYSALLLVALLLPAPALAQVRHAEQVNVWAGVASEVVVSPRVALYEELALRRADWGRTWQSRSAAQGVMLTLGRYWRLGAGYTYGHASPYGALPAPAARDESQLWAHATLGFETGRLRWSSRTRGEWRWIQDTPRWRRSARWREQLRIVWAPWPHTWLYGSGEAHVRLYPVAERYALEQTRAQVGVGHALAPATSVEVGYLNQHVRRPTAREENHTLVLNVRTRWRLR